VESAATPVPAPTTTEPATPGPAPSDAAVSFTERLEAQIEVAGSPDWPLAAFDSIWVLAPDLPMTTGSGAPNLVRIDPTTNKVVATIELPDRLCQGFTASDDAIWACSADALVRIDPTSNEIVDSVPVQSGQAFYRPVFGGGMVWALGSSAFVSDTVVRLDPASKETTSFEMAGSVGGLVYAFDALWLTVTGEGLVVRLDPATGAAETVAMGLQAPTGIVAGDESLWVSLFGAEGGEAGVGDTQLVRIDPTTGDILAEFAIGGSPKGGVEIWADQDGLLVRSTNPWLTRIDPATNEVVETLVSDTAVQGPVTVAFGSIWTVEIERDSVYRLSR
jgi:streptogramin lyase